MEKIFVWKDTEKRKKVIIYICGFLLILLIAFGYFIPLDKIGINLLAKNRPPSWEYLFGTDWLGRNMFYRTIKGLTYSFAVGIVAALSSTLIAFIFSILAVTHQYVDRLVTWLIDLFLSIPHLVTLLLISFAFGGGFKGVVIGLALTHWPSFTRLIRAELMQLKKAEYVAISKKLGKSNYWVIREHYLPYVMPQLLIGFILMFPHAILHEAAITFLGFGLSSESPAIGIILSESMQYLSVGLWWLAFFPGLALLCMVTIFDVLGRNVRGLYYPFNR